MNTVTVNFCLLDSGNTTRLFARQLAVIPRTGDYVSHDDQVIDTPRQFRVENVEHHFISEFASHTVSVYLTPVPQQERHDPTSLVTD